MFAVDKHSRCHFGSLVITEATTGSAHMELKHLKAADSILLCLFIIWHVKLLMLEIQLGKSHLASSLTQSCRPLTFY